MLTRGEVRHEVLEENRAVRADVGVPSHLEHRVVVRIPALPRDGLGQVVVVTGEYGEQRFRRGAAADAPAARGGVREDLTPEFPAPHVVALSNVGAVEHLQVEVRAHRVVRGEGIAAEAEVRGDEFRKREEDDGDFVGMRDEGVVVGPQVQRVHHVSRGGQIPEVLPRALHAHRVRSSAPAEDRHLRVLTDAVEGSELGVQVRVHVAGEVRQELLRGDGARGVQEEIGRERRAHRGDGGGGGTRELLRRPLGQGGIDRDRGGGGGGCGGGVCGGGGSGRVGAGRGCGGDGGDHRGRVLRRGRRWTRGEVRVDGAEFVRGDPVVGEVKLGEEHLELPLLQAEAGVRGEDSRQLGPAIAYGERGTR